MKGGDNTKSEEINNCINNEIEENDCLCRVINCLIKNCTGPTGPTGATGPTGPKGDSFVSNSYAMVHDESNSTIQPNDPLLLQATNLSNNITYDSSTGNFNIPEKGTYIIHWWVNVRNKNKDDCTPRALGIEFHQYLPNDILIAHSSTHNKISCCDTGTINGNAIFNATDGSSFRFLNTSGIPIDLVPNDLYSASVSITRIA